MESPELVYLDHFHVHIVQVSYSGFTGMNVGQAHLLDAIIALVSTLKTAIFHPSINNRYSLSSIQRYSSAFLFRIP